ncbi:NAD-dependent epimerase/dehydratase family protein [Psychroflexus sp. YR1-1]|uniref:NAD-dependent epimerase/dehydratase family protein n=1 Tax=Psychroflexus aurantiacus TaxID=2709310 RepID=A0A6B3R0A0_9FLAO|nr:SDR family oxidoreductase [Psychroflexus aurantiacus]NEV93993.1 NAD-dependent epimerase/dehydratase family protein [Psychroflexus aurantiacus]
MNCLLTGSTGILGSHILFEWIRKALEENSVNHLFVVIRSNHRSAYQRLLAVLQDESRPEFLDNYSLDECLQKITVLDSDLVSLQASNLRNYEFDTVIHAAASTSLSQTTTSRDKVHKQNLLVTKHLLKHLPGCVKRFIYIGTAYSYGIQEKKVHEKIEDYSVTNFRNAYEKSKFESETYVKQFCLKHKLKVQILRPSIICGRLIDKPYYETPKFDVFYSWAIFLNKYARGSKDNFRIWINKDSGLNIVPVDFVSKAVLYAYLKPSIKELNIVNPEPILHKNYIGHVLHYFNIPSFELLTQMPIHLNQLESLYYKSIGAVFEKYISIPDLKFHSDAILKLIHQLQLDSTLGVHENFINLINFSVEKNFRKSY